jgi:hypothetical protein
VRRPFAYFPPRVTEVDLNGFKSVRVASLVTLAKLEISLVSQTQILRYVPEAQAEIRAAPSEIPIAPSSLVVDCRTGLGIAQPRGHQLVVVDKELVMYSLGNEPIADMAAGDGVLVVAMRNTIVHVLRERELSTFFTYLCSVSSVDVVSGFDTIVVASQEGTILLCSLLKGSVRSSFTVPDRQPLAVKLTHAWGIVVVLSVDNFGLTHWISSYTMEGELVNQFQVRQRPSVMSVFTSGSGFDYIAFADERNAVYTADAIRGKPDTSIAVLPRKVSLLAYDVTKRLLVAATLGGSVWTISAAWE